MEDETLVTDGTGSSSSDAVAKNNGTAIKDDSVRVIKSPLDDRTYLACSLPHNDLRVLLVSDPRSLEAGAAVAVHVGATSDPSTLPGLAHFCEHMLFLGTRQYPQEDSFESFLALNGGSSNAFTDSEQTVYYMDLEIESVDRGSSNNSNKFEEALLRFGSFFTSPLFTESATGREVNAIDSENAKNLQSDTFRYFQLTKARANPLHPFSKFFTGNKRTLLPDSEPSSDRATITTSSSSSPASLSSRLREELLRFYQTYYSSNTMTLAVIGPQPVTELRSMVETAFSNVPNRHVVEPELEWNGKVPPFVDDVKGQANKGNDEKAEEESSSTHGQSQSAIIPPFGSVLEIVPVQDLRQVTLTFPIMYGNNIPMDRQTSLLIKPSSYVAQLLGHEGPKSLLSYLKSRGWANSIAAGTEEKLSDFETFEVVVGLTPNGLTALDDVILSVFSYLNMIRDRFIPSYVFEEVLRLDELQWRYQTKGPLGSYVQSLATSMQRYPPQLYVAGPRRLALDGIYHEGEGLGDDARSSFPNRHALDRTRELVRQYVSAMTVDNAMVSVLSKTFEGQTDAKEKWYGTAYRVRPIPSSTLELWRRGVSPRLLRIDFPRPNPFLPREAGLRVKHPPQDDNSSGDTASSSREAARSFESRMTPPVPPRIIRDDGRWTVHFKEDDRFGQPKGYLIFQILTQDPYSSAKRAALSNLYEVCVSDRLREYAYDGTKLL
jgi:insulysin